jgi:quercetin 2,3-dioxygenase
MSNLEAAPAELACRGGQQGAGGVEVLTARDVPLGGPRAMRVRRTLPQRQRSLIGAWCFADHYGPDVTTGTGMVVAPHPHTGLQTVSWLFDGEIEHRDSAGSHALVRPGELNLMTSGRGISHSEVSTPATTVLHGVQLWVALPDAHRNVAPAFGHYAELPAADLGGGTARVFLGTLAGLESPVPVYSPLLGAEIALAPRARLSLPAEPAYEHGVLVDAGPVALSGTRLERAELGYLPPGADSVELVNLTDEQARILLLGGAPFAEDIIMWWNFVGRSHEEIAGFRAAWEGETGQFGRVEGYAGTPRRLPAPPLPNARLKPRTR